MSEVDNMKQVGICLDIVSRISLVAMAKSCTSKEIEMSYALISGLLKDQYGDDEVKPLIEAYKKGTLELKKAFGL